MDQNLLETAFEISRSLTEPNSLRANLSVILELLGKNLELTRAVVLLYQDEAEKLDPVAIFGLSLTEFRKLESRVEKTLLSKVFESGKPVTIPRLSLEPTLDFLKNSDEERILISVPILIGQQTIGVFSTEFPYRKNFDFENRNTFLLLISSMISHSLILEKAVQDEKQRLIEENSHLRQELKEKYNFGQIIGNSSPMRQVYDQVTQVARSNATILLRGESGTGKEMIANAIHYNSLRSKKPFIKVNCAALPETLIESELFGYEKGAFTGADRSKKGRFELADGGTLFLDEIGDLPPQTQIKLLRVLQEREFEKVGGIKTIKINVRLITATNKDLEEEISNGNFREDLFYRLNVFTIFLPPLRERKSDILLLAEHFVEKYEVEHGKRIRRISTPAIDMLTSYHFPGNVRELENAIERAVLVCDSSVIHGHHLPPTLQTAEVSGTVSNLSLTTSVEAFEKDLIQDALKSTRGNVAKASSLLDTTERIIGYKIKKYGINKKRFR
ncbi:MAG: sigma 54-interacting transcriptional regulator [Pyrinomonadaceae bacterium]